jgi:hypothetical protein
MAGRIDSQRAGRRVRLIPRPGGYRYYQTMGASSAVVVVADDVSRQTGDLLPNAKHPCEGST